eukprot:NODE_6403_length_509_cov_335.000000.p5 GENE.NODE_6403_length_509_cov_335.000000~~NODE_6403_length_509_cov_335.000000.p5  ORF type:complete len:72 (-),score=9.10 NODE_6403_length_509_cov_335.000000:116-331(-)
MPLACAARVTNGGTGAAICAAARGRQVVFVARWRTSWARGRCTSDDLEDARANIAEGRKFLANLAKMCELR